MTKRSQPIRALIYVRKSRNDGHIERSRSVAEQEAESRAWCLREGWLIVGVEQDDGISASRYSRRRRDGWEAAQARIASGTIDVLVTWEASRASRDLAAYTALRDLCAGHGVLWAYNGTAYDFRDREARFRTALDALLAENESDMLSARIQRSMRARAQAGKAMGRTPYGYVREFDPFTRALVGQYACAIKAPIVVEIVTRVGDGEFLLAIAGDLTLRGIPAPRGAGTWHPQTVRTMATSLVYAGLRVHRPEDDRLPTNTYPGQWEPLVSREMIDRAITAVGRNVVTLGARATSPVFPLAGLFRCSRCGSRMYGRGKRQVYECRNQRWNLEHGRQRGGAHLSIRRITSEPIVSTFMTELLRPGSVPDDVRDFQTPVVARAIDRGWASVRKADDRREVIEALVTFTVLGGRPGPPRKGVDTDDWRIVPALKFGR